jgi:hypothetical protein
MNLTHFRQNRFQFLSSSGRKVKGFKSPFPHQLLIGPFPFDISSVSSGIPVRALTLPSGFSGLHSFVGLSCGSASITPVVTGRAIAPETRVARFCCLFKPFPPACRTYLQHLPARSRHRIIRHLPRQTDLRSECR